MARSSEKAQSMLARYLRQKKESDADDPSSSSFSSSSSSLTRRPYLAESVTSLSECEKWRKQLIREIGQNVMKIQNASIGEELIRDLNDQINKELREKKHWERQIKALGGPDYSAAATATAGNKWSSDESSFLDAIDADGKHALGVDGYYYFGAAKDLPGVRDLYTKRTALLLSQRAARLRLQLYKKVDADYYGYRDDEDGRLKQEEEKEEKRWRENQIKQLKKKRKRETGQEQEEDEEGTEEEEERKVSELIASGGGSGNGSDVDVDSFVLRAHVELPSTAEIERMIVEKKKQELLKKYAGYSASTCTTQPTTTATATGISTAALTK